MSLSQEERERFVSVIDSLLAASDLNTISEKRIRKGLQAAVDYDLDEKKGLIKELIMARFDLAMAKQSPQPQTNGYTDPKSPSSASPDSDPAPTSVPKKHKQESPSTEEYSEVQSSPQPKKRRKVDEESDIAYAKKLQAMENQRMRATRGGGAKPSKPVKRRSPKKKSSGKVKAEDDSDVEGSGSAKERKVNRNTGFHKELTLSASLSALLDNETKLSRPQTVKRIWNYVRERDLQDPNDKRMIRCDEAMRAVFKQDKIHMFTMNKVLNQNLYATDE